VRDPLDKVIVQSSPRKAILVTVSAVLLLIAYGMVFPTQVAIVGVVLTLPIIIMLHEAAHFFAAKRAGMKVTEFFIGFGPRIWSFRRGETEYGVKAVVLGGYCRIIGMTNLEEVAPEDEPRAYRSKGYFSRVGVAFAGPAVHFLIAFVLMFAVFAIAGDVMHQRALTRLDDTSLGAKAAGIRAGDTLVSIDGVPITQWSQVSGVVGRHDAGDVVRFVVDRNGEEITRDVTLTQTIYDDGQKAIVAGIQTTVETPQPSIVSSFVKAPAGVVTVGHEAVNALGKIFSPSGISQYFSVLSGSDKSEEANQQRFLSPVGFAQVATHAVDAGWLAVVQLLLVINVFLGLVNLVPLLPFDGGHIAIATYEQIMSTITRRRIRVDVAKLMPVAGAVLVVLLFIAVSSLFLDITHPVGNPY
jgi:membrane-associated protease RseP (regulator of RpoE activity)